MMEPEASAVLIYLLTMVPVIIIGALFARLALIGLTLAALVWLGR